MAEPDPVVGPSGGEYNVNVGRVQETEFISLGAAGPVVGASITLHTENWTDTINEIRRLQRTIEAEKVASGAAANGHRPNRQLRRHPKEGS